jgi:Na+/H+-dicarboxylate symporter
MLYIAVIILGLISGWSDNAWLHGLGMLLAEIFIHIFKCISIPIIFLSIIVTLSNYRSDGLMRRVWQRTLCYTLGTTLLAAAVSCGLYYLVSPSSVVTAMPHALPTVKTISYMDHIASLVPENLLTPFIENQILSVLFLGILIGVALRWMPDDEAKHALTAFFRGLHGVMLVITRWVIVLIPIGLYGFITSTVLQLRAGGGNLQGIGEYLLIIIAANLIQGLVILPLWLRWYGLKPFVAMRGMLPALSLAFFSKSSVGTLPVTMETIEKKLGVKPQISRFVLPLCTSINMNGCAAFIFTTVIYLMQNNGSTFSFPMMALWVVVATAAAIGNAGVPMGCFFLSVSLLSSMNVPITLMGVILPFYSVIDMLETALNVWSDACVTQVINLKVSQDVAT